MPEKKSREIHFAKMNHNQRVAACQCLAARPLRAINIIANKRVIPADIYTDKNQLYFYMTRYLVERVSWVCRDYQQEADENCAVKITFSRRGGMSYLSFQDYLRRLRSQNTEIHWPAIDIDAIDAQDHSRVAALQLADAITSGVAAGVEPDKFGNCESRYAEILKRITYRRGENYLSYGFKIVPNIADIDLSDDQRRTVAIFNGGK